MIADIRTDRWTEKHHGNSATFRFNKWITR